MSQGCHFAGDATSGSTSFARGGIVRFPLSGGAPLAATCAGCHKDGEPPAAARTIEQFMEEEEEIWHRMLDFFAFELARYGIAPVSEYPYFSGSFDTAVGTVFGGSGVVDAATTRGIAMNLKLLLDEKFHSHSRSKARTLVAESITYLQKGNIGDRTQIYPDANLVIRFTDYSAARPMIGGDGPGSGVGITLLKSYLTKPVAGGYVRR